MLPQSHLANNLPVVLIFVKEVGSFVIPHKCRGDATWKIPIGNVAGVGCANGRSGLWVELVIFASLEEVNLAI